MGGLTIFSCFAIVMRLEWELSRICSARGVGGGGRAEEIFSDAGCFPGKYFQDTNALIIVNIIRKGG